MNDFIKNQKMGNTKYTKSTKKIVVETVTILDYKNQQVVFDVISRHKEEYANYQTKGWGEERCFQG